MSQARPDLIGDHASLHGLRQLIDRVAVSAVRTVLIYGETGTGKGLVARMIHDRSPRAGEQFMDINCAAIPASLLESELFGHEKGAFTGAVERKIGLIEAANRGTVFLDEIREMDLTLQTKLLSLLDNQRFRRVGAVRPTEVNVRFIATTNQILLGEVKAGRFRQDLYYRLQVVALNIPALRERGEDILRLTDHFIARFNRMHGRQVTGLSPEARAIFLSYAWPGNVRELENLIERILIMEDGDTILPAHLPDRIHRAVSGRDTPAPPAAGTEAEGGFHDLTAAYQRRLIEAALARSGGSQQGAAAILHLSRHALRHQMTKLGLPH